MAKIVFKGIEHTLKLDFNAICSFEQATGKSFIGFANNLTQNGAMSMQINDARALLWAGLLHENKALKIDDIGDSMGFDNLGEIMGAIAEAITEAMPSAKETDKKKEQK
jgi:hypothetical protein